MRNISYRKKRYVEVTSHTDEDGVVRPLSITWYDGRVFPIDKILDARQAASLKVGGTGMRYLVRIGRIETLLWYENPRWFVEEIIRSAVLPNGGAT